MLNNYQPMADNISLSVVVPCYNEEKNIPLIAERFNAAKPAGLAAELILVDNGSGDGTAAAITNAADKYPFVKIAVVKNNIGYGYGILTGLKIAAGEFLCWTHADLQTDVADAFNAYRLALRQENPQQTFIKGYRRGRKLYDRFFTISMALFESLLLGQWLWEINAQPKMFHRSFLNFANDPPHDWSLDLYFYYLAKKHKFKVKTIPVEFTPRIHGMSHWNTGGAGPKIKFIKRTLAYSFKLRRRLN